MAWKSNEASPMEVNVGRHLSFHALMLVLVACGACAQEVGPEIRGRAEIDRQQRLIGVEKAIIVVDEAGDFSPADLSAAREDIATALRQCGVEVIAGGRGKVLRISFRISKMELDGEVVVSSELMGETRVFSELNEWQGMAAIYSTGRSLEVFRGDFTVADVLRPHLSHLTRDLESALGVR